MSAEVWKPPTLAELSTDLETAAKMDVLNLALNQEPPKSWIKEHPMINVKIGEREGQNIMAPLQYIPIDKQRLLGKRFFGSVDEEILREGVMFQSVYVVVRLHYTHPLTGEKKFHDGIGAVDAQTKKGSSAADLANINPGAIQKGLPAAASYAVKNAYDKFGRLFGGEIQKDAIQFTENYAAFAKSFYDTPNQEDLSTLFEMKKEALTEDEVTDALRILNNKETNSYNKLFKLLQSK